MRAFLVFLCSWLTSLVSAQISTDLGYPPINENLFLNTRWKYTYTTHAETNTIIHKADKFYEHFIFYKYDYTYSIYLNGVFSGGEWRLNDALNQVYSPFRNIQWWKIQQFTDDMLVLEYSLHSKANYRYHFVRVTPEQAPFQRSANDLPDVEVNYLSKNDDKYRYRYVKAEKGKRGGKGKRKDNKKQTDTIAPEPELLQVELVGGGFFGGIDPVYRNNLVIKTDGTVIKEYQTEQQGLRVTRRTIPRANLEKLVQLIEEKNFFNLEQIYTCESPDCSRRLTQQPRPIALRIAVTKGYRRKLITISVWEGFGAKNHWVVYPPEIDLIVKAIEDVALFSPEVQ